ncbi:MAG: hypothetical protein R2784_11645 [Saprospiraceae bacterium]
MITKGLPFYRIVNVMLIVLAPYREMLNPIVMENVMGLENKEILIIMILRDSWDVLQYIEGILNNNLNATLCTDLNSDGDISVIDAVLLQECALNENSPPDPGHNHIPCEFPYKVDNPFDSVWLYLSIGMKQKKYIDLEYKGSLQRPISIAVRTWKESRSNQLEITLNNYNGEVFHNENKVIVFSKTEDLIGQRPSIGYRF